MSTAELLEGDDEKGEESIWSGKSGVCDLHAKGEFVVVWLLHVDNELFPRTCLPKLFVSCKIIQML